MSSSLKLVTLGLLSVNVSCFPGPDPGAYNISKTVWATEREVPSYDLEKVILITGGTGRKSAEIYNPATKASCSLPQFSEVRTGHSQNGGLTCGGGVDGSSALTTCVKWNPTSGNWDQFAELKEPRISHVSWETASGVYLMGGGSSPKTSERVTEDGSELGFDRKYDASQACAIPAENEMVIITGGGYADIRKMKIVSVYNVDGWQRDLTPMNVGRRMHACSSYVKGGKKVYLVTGGVTIFNGNPGIRIDSTEVYSDNAWRFVGKLPKTICGMSATTLDNKVLLFGGNDGSDSKMIQEFSPETEEWSVIGAMEEARRHNRVSVVSFDDYTKSCSGFREDCENTDNIGKAEWAPIIDCREELNLAVTPPDETSDDWRTAMFDPRNDNQLWRQDSDGRIINKANGKVFKWDQFGAGFEESDSDFKWRFNTCIRSSQELSGLISQKLQAKSEVCLNTANRFDTSGSVLGLYPCKTIHPINGCLKFKESKPTGLLLTGGGAKEVELYNPVSKTSCALPALPGVRGLHSQDGPLLCGGNENTHLKPMKSCLLWNSGNETWIQSHSLPTVRHYHCSWTPKSGTGTYLIGGGGGNAQWTSDLVKPDGTIETSFPLKHKTVHACSIQENDRVIITGGHSTATVSVYDENGWKEDLSDLKFGRMAHACTSFVSGGKKLMMVSGGSGWGSVYTDTSEIWNGSEWRLTTGKLPYTARDVRMAFIDNRILYMGGWDKSTKRTTILSFSLESEDWTQEGDMLIGRSAHGISVVDLNDYAKSCNQVILTIKTSEGQWSGCDSCLSIEINTPQGSCRTNTIPGILEVDSTQNVTGSVLGSCESLHTDTVTSVVFHHKGGDGWIGDHITIKLSEEKSFFCPAGLLKESENKRQLQSTCTEQFKLESGYDVIKKDNLVATLPSWGDYFEVSLQIWIESFAQNGIEWTELFRFTATEKDCCSAGDRIPALFVNKAGYIYATSQVGPNGNFYKAFNIPPKTWTMVQIKQYPENGKAIYEFIVDGKSVVKTQNIKPTLYENVKVWVAQGKHHPVANARIKDFKYESKTCHLGWTYLEHTGNCYKHDPTKRSWTEALESCRSSSPSSTLSSVHDDATNEFLTALSGGSKWTWLGGYQDDKENWHWADGSKWTGYNNWGPGQPDNHGNLEHHLGLNFPNTGQWNDFGNIHHPQGSICQYKPSQGLLVTGGSNNIKVSPYDELKEELEEIKGENEELQSELSALMQQLVGLSHNLTELHGTVDDFNFDETLITDLISSSDDFSKHISSFNYSLASLATSVNDHESKLDSHHDQIHSVIVKTVSNSKNIEGISTVVDGHKTKVDQVTQDVLNLKTSDKQQETRIVDNIQKLNSLKTSYQKQENRIVDHIQKLNSLKTSDQKQENRIDGISHNLTELGVTADFADAVLTDLISFSDDFSEHISSFNDSLTSLATSVNDHETKIGSNHDQIHSVIVKAASNSKNIEGLSTVVDGHKTKVDQVTQDLVNLKTLDKQQEIRIVDNIQKLNSLKISDQDQENRIVDNLQKLNSLKISDQKQENRIVDNIQKLNSLKISDQKQENRIVDNSQKLNSLKISDQKQENRIVDNSQKLNSLKISDQKQENRIVDNSQKLNSLKISDQKQENRLVDNIQKLNSLKISDQKQGYIITDNIKKLKSVSTHGKWCGYRHNGWTTEDSPIKYESLKFLSSNMDITSTPLNINTGIFTVPVSGAWRVTYSLHSRVDTGEVNRLYLYINGVALPESYHWTRSSSRKTGSTGGRELTLQVKAGDTMSLRATTIDDSLLKIYFCVAFEHGTDQQKQFSARDEDIPTLDYKDSFPAGLEDIPTLEYEDIFPAGDEDIPSLEYQDHFSAGDEEYFSPDVKKSDSTCSSNTDCPSNLSCIRSLWSSDPGTCGDPWCWREEWNCGSGARCIIVNHRPRCQGTDE